MAQAMSSMLEIKTVPKIVGECISDAEKAVCMNESQMGKKKLLFLSFDLSSIIYSKLLFIFLNEG